MVVNNLYPLPEAARLLGGISIWTLRKQIARGNVRVTRIGKRILLRSEEIERIREEGLPPLRVEAKANPDFGDQSKLDQGEERSCLTK